MKNSLAAVLCLGLAFPVLANDGAVTGVGGTIQLLDEHPGISLVAENIDVTVNNRTGAVMVECLFILTNHGDADTVRIGFPENYGGDTGPRPFESFSSTVNGRPMECARTPENPDAERPLRFWWIKEVDFQAGETKIVRNVYRAPAGHLVGDEQGDWRTFEYTLSTGASWAGLIQAATLTFTVEDCDSSWDPTMFSIEPDQADECRYSWTFQGFEPGISGPQAVKVAWRTGSGEN